MGSIQVYSSSTIVADLVVYHAFKCPLILDLGLLLNEYKNST